METHADRIIRMSHASLVRNDASTMSQLSPSHIWLGYAAVGIERGAYIFEIEITAINENLSTTRFVIPPVPSLSLLDETALGSESKFMSRDAIL